MARRSGPTIEAQDAYRPASDDFRRGDHEDVRLIDLDSEQESPFLRGQKRVPARRGPLPKKTAVRLKWIALAGLIVLLVGATGFALYDYGEHSWRFRINSSGNIAITGLHNVTRLQVMDALGGDIGRNIFFVPLALRKQQLEQIPWVESASVMRFVPNQLKVEIHERSPVAFVRNGARILLIDANGVFLELSASRRKYSFPVIVGLSAAEPLSMRAARMRVFGQLLREIDSSGAHYSQDIDDVDLSDPDDVKITVADSGRQVAIHLGSSNFLERYRTYVAHIREWHQQFEKIESVDLRYDHQIIVNPDVSHVVPVPVPAASVGDSAAANKPVAPSKAKPPVLKHATKRAAAKPAPVYSGAVAEQSKNKPGGKLAGHPTPPSSAGASRKPSAAIMKDQGKP